MSETTWPCDRCNRPVADGDGRYLEDDRVCATCEALDGAILRLSSTGATCYPLSDGQYLMCGTARDGESVAVVTRLARPESLEVVRVGTGPRDVKVEELVEHLKQAGEAMKELWVKR